MFALLLPYVDRASSYHAINFAFGPIATPDSPASGAINYTALSIKVAAYACPSDTGHVVPLNKQRSPSGVTYNACAHGSYAGVVGTVDIFRFWCDCPAGRKDNLVCFGGHLELRPDGAFGYNHAFTLAQFRDGLSHTMLMGELSRFSDDPDPMVNNWNVALPISSPSTPGVTRPQSLSTTVPRLNADLRIPDFPQTHPVSWKKDPRNREMGQFGFRSQHFDGAHFLFADGSARFLKNGIDLVRIYRPLSTREGNETFPGPSPF